MCRPGYALGVGGAYIYFAGKTGVHLSPSREDALSAVLLTDHLYHKMVHFYHDGSGLIQNDSAPITDDPSAKPQLKQCWCLFFPPVEFHRFTKCVLRHI